MKESVKFCWECGHKLWGNKYIKKLIDDNIRVLHIQCGKRYPDNPEIIEGGRENENHFVRRGKRRNNQR